MYGPFKKMINTASDAWMKMNPAKTMTIYNIPSLVNTAFPLAATPKNIQAGFQCTGIWPFNPEIFQDSDFAPSQIIHGQRKCGPDVSNVNFGPMKPAPRARTGTFATIACLIKQNG